MDEHADALAAAAVQLIRACKAINVEPPELHFDSDAGEAIRYTMLGSTGGVNNYADGPGDAKLCGLVVKWKRPRAYQHELPAS